MTNSAIESAPAVAAPSNERAAFEYRLQVRGIFLKNRKCKSQGWTLKTSETKLDQVAIAALATDGLAKCRLKAGGQFAVIETPVTITEHTSHDGVAYRSVSFMMYSGVNVLSGRV